MGYFKEKDTRGLINHWVTQRVAEILGFEDEVVTGMVINTLDEEVSPAIAGRACGAAAVLPSIPCVWCYNPTVACGCAPVLPGQKLDPLELTLNITGFLEKDALAFVVDLWRLLVSGQSNPLGVPDAFIDAKLKQVAAAKVRGDAAKACSARCHVVIPGCSCSPSLPAACASL